MDSRLSHCCVIAVSIHQSCFEDNSWLRVVADVGPEFVILSLPQDSLVLSCCVYRVCHFLFYFVSPSLVPCLKFYLWFGIFPDCFHLCLIYVSVCFVMMSVWPHSVSFLPVESWTLFWLILSFCFSVCIWVVILRHLTLQEWKCSADVM